MRRLQASDYKLGSLWLWRAASSICLLRFLVDRVAVALGAVFLECNLPLLLFLPGGPVIPGFALATDEADLDAFTHEVLLYFPKPEACSPAGLIE
jgi:hypothetical protein